VGNQWHFDPDTYAALVRSEIAAYDELQGALADASATVNARSVLDLGAGTGVTATAVLARHPGAALIGLDASPEMLAYARIALPEASFVVGRLEDPLPPGPFDLVVSAFAVHHLDESAKADLFRRITSVLVPGGRFVLCDVVVPDRPVERPVPLEDGFDRPSTLADQLRWLADAGLVPHVVRAENDLAVVAADRPPADA
jgi:tRNA (cmo5U34)-methyltransferase